MGNRIFGVVVILLWATTMSWLLTAKILPPMFRGEPPPEDASGKGAPVAWRIVLKDRPCGYAVTQSVDGALNTTEVHTRVVLEEIPIAEIAPRWMVALVNDIGEIRLDMRSRTTLDSFGNLASLETRMSLNDMPSAVRVAGRVTDGKLKIRLRSGDIERRAEYPWRQGGLLAGELAPEAKLLHLEVGKRWRKEVYSPLGAPHHPVELVEAEVVSRESIWIGGTVVDTRRIEFRSVPTAGVSNENRLRAIMWVDLDGRVLRHDAYFMNTKLRFERVSDEESARLAAEELQLDVYATLRTPKRDKAPEPTPPAER